MKIRGIRPKLAEMGRWAITVIFALSVADTKIGDYTTWNVQKLLFLIWIFSEISRAKHEGRVAGIREGCEFMKTEISVAVEKAYQAGAGNTLINKMADAITAVMPPNEPPPAGSA